MRRVQVFEYGGDGQYHEPYSGWFHEWGVNFVEFESGPGNYSVALVEKLDGSIDAVFPHMIRFDESYAEVV